MKIKSKITASAVLWGILFIGLAACSNPTSSPQAYSIGGTVSDYANTQPLQNVQVRLSNAAGTIGTPVLTGEDGRYAFSNVASGGYTIEASLAEYHTKTLSFNVTGDLSGKDITLVSSETILFSISGTISVPDQNSTGGALVTVRSDTVELGSAAADAEGNYTISGIPQGPCTLTVTLNGYTDYEESFTLSGDITKNIVLISTAVSQLALELSFDDTPIQPGETAVFPNTRGDDFMLHASTKTLKLTNTGDADMVISGVNVLSQEASVFFISTSIWSSPPKYPITLAKDASLEINIKFKPVREASLADEALFTGVAAISVSSPAVETIAVNLLGRGVGSGSYNLILKYNGVFYDYYSYPELQKVWKGEAGTPETITLMNWGLSPLELSGIALTSTDSDFILTAPSCSEETPLVLQDLTYADISLTFSPTSFGAHTAKIRFDYKSGSSSYYYERTLNVEGDWYAVKRITAVDEVFYRVERLFEYGGDILVYGAIKPDNSYIYAVYRYNGASLSELRYNETSIVQVKKFIKYGSDVLICASNHLYRYNGTSVTQDITGYYDYDQIRTIGSLVYFIDDRSSGIAGDKLYVYDGSTVTAVDKSATPEIQVASSSNSAATELLGVMGDDLIISALTNMSEPRRKIYRVTGTVLYQVTNSSDFVETGVNGLVYQGKIYFIGMDSSDIYKMYVYNGATRTVENVPAFAGASLEYHSTELGVFENKMYYRSKTGAQIYEFDGTSLAALEVPEGGKVSSDPSSIEWNSSLVMLTYGTGYNEKYLLALRGGQFSRIERPAFESPVLYEGKIICGGGATEISTAGASMLYAGDSGYNRGFGTPALAHGKLYFIGETYMYQFSYTR
jgi:hypothetical protein